MTSTWQYTPWRYVVIVLCGLLGLILAFNLAQQPQNSLTTLLIEQEQQRVEITYHRQIAFPANCVLLRWQVTGAQAVFVAGMARPLQGEEPCLLNLAARHVVEVVWADGSRRAFPLTTQVWLLQPLTLVQMLLVGYCAFVVVYLGFVPWHARIAQFCRERPLGIWLSLGLAYVPLGALASATQEASGLPAVLFSLAALGGIWAALQPSSQARWRAFLRPRWMLIAPFGVFVFKSAAFNFEFASQSLPLLLSVAEASVALFSLWLMLGWLFVYFSATFEANRIRQAHWFSLLMIAFFISLIALLWANYRSPQWQWWQGELPTTYLMYRTGDQNPDVLLYVPYTQDYPAALRENPLVQRPTLHVLTSQVCLALDVIAGTSVDGVRGCSHPDLAVLAHLVVNAALLGGGLLLIYELVRHYSGLAPRIAFYAACLTALSPFQVWFLSIPSTDYADFMISIWGLWLLHRLYSNETPFRAQSATLIGLGLAFGLLLLIKLNLIVLFFGLFLLPLRPRGRVVFALVVIPLAVYWLNGQLLQVYGIAPNITELQNWRTVNWLFDELFYYGAPYPILRTLTEWLGFTADKVALLFGFLLPFAVWVMITDERYPRSVFALAWGMFLVMVLFLWVFQYPYINLVIGLFPWVYGAVALGVDGIAQRLRASGRSRGLIWACYAIPILHVLFQWSAWSLRHFLNYYGIFTKHL
jgi:hypothetical protein